MKLNLLSFVTAGKGGFNTPEGNHGINADRHMTGRQST